MPNVRKRPKICIILIIISICILFPNTIGFKPAAWAKSRSISFIRDAEIEHTIRTYATPIFQAAGLNADRIRIYIINEDSINAFVTGGDRMFLHTGLLLADESPLGLVGVLAHETGHIAGGHLVRTGDEMRKASALQVASLILGVGAGALTKNVEAAATIIWGGSAMAEKKFLAYSRTQESAADQAALSLLTNIGVSAEGLRTILGILQSQELLSPSAQDPYLRTHPMTRERMAIVDAHIKAFERTHHHRNTDLGLARPGYPDKWASMHERMLAKLRGFLWRPGKVYRKYPEQDTSEAANYARAIATYRSGDYETAETAVQELRDEAPNDPFFHELLGQMAFEVGRFSESINHYKQATDLRPDAPLILSALGKALVTLNQPEATIQAENILKKSVEIDPEQSLAWHNLAIIFARQNKPGAAALAASERFFRSNQISRADTHIKRALDLLPKGSPNYQKALDLANSIALSSKSKR